jgi:hypothetical protein
VSGPTTAVQKASTVMPLNTPSFLLFISKVATPY